MTTTDKTGREIMVGDTLKVFHFIGARRRRHFMYKYVSGIVSGNYFRISHLNPKDEAYLMEMDGRQHDDIEIVQGFGADGTPFDERPKTS